jgi:thimet oligopeptidase
VKTETTPTPAETSQPSVPEPVAEPVPAPENPPQPPQSEAEALLERCRGHVARSKTIIEKLLAEKGERTMANTVQPWHDVQIELVNAGSFAGLFREVHPNVDVRTAGETCEREVAAYATELSLDRNVYDALAAVKTDGFDPEARRFVERELRDFRRAGVDKDDATRARLKELADKAVEIGQVFDRNIRDDVRSISIDPAKLDGLPEDYKAAHPPGPDGKVKITTDYPDFLDFRAYAKDANARRDLVVAFYNRGYPDNEQVLRDLLANKAERAKLLGYPTWAHYQLEILMSKDPKTVQTFIDQVHATTKKRAKKDYAELLAEKKKELPKAKTVEEWDRAYYIEKVRKASYDFDGASIRPYFEFNRVKEGLLAITAKLYDVEYEPAADATKWHDSVEVYDVMRGGKKLGRIFLDLHPREGKFKHAAQFQLVDGVEGRQLPEGVLVCNFPDPRVSKPALMNHADVETFFHEFGHLMHHVLGGHVKWVSFAGTATERDFVESPSMMFEEWARDPGTLALFARHHQTGEALDPAVVTKLRRASTLGRGVNTQRQLGFAKISLDIYTADPRKLDLDSVEKGAIGKYTMFPPMPIHYWSNFGHLNGYDAAYYTYLWSDVISKDLLSEFKKNGLLDAKTAGRYRDTILAPGGSRDAADMVKEFLGRPYGFEAYKAWMEE